MQKHDHMCKGVRLMTHHSVFIPLMIAALACCMEVNQLHAVPPSTVFACGIYSDAVTNVPASLTNVTAIAVPPISRPSLVPETKTNVTSSALIAPILITGHSSGLAFTPDGERLTSGNSIWSAINGDLLVGSGAKPRDGRPAFSPDGKYMANSLDILDAPTGGRVTLIKPEFGDKKVYGVAFSPDGKRFAAGKGDWGSGDIHTFSIPGGELMQTFIGHTNPVWDVAFSPDGRLLASASGTWKNHKTGGPGEVKLWHVTAGEAIQSHSTRFCLYSIAFSGNGRRYAASGGAYSGGYKLPQQGEIRVWDVASGREVFSAPGLASCIYSVALSPDGKRLLAAVGASGRDGVFDVKLWDVETGHEITTLGRHEKKVYGVAFSADGKRAASGGLDRTIKIWSLD
jgi:WD40 repeat protein